MKNINLLLSVVLLIVLSCSGQTHKKEKESVKTETKEIHKEAPGEPKVDIKVNKRFDKKGNLVGFDSTYTSYYKGVRKDSLLMDTLFHQFNSFFKSNYPGKFGIDIDKLFFDDSLFYSDFFHDDFFSKRFELNRLYLEKMMHRMDSIKNSFYKEKSKTIKN